MDFKKNALPDSDQSWEDKEKLCTETWINVLAITLAEKQTLVIWPHAHSSTSTDKSKYD